MSLGTTATEWPTASYGGFPRTVSCQARALTVIVATSACIAACCSWLNGIYYESHSPFYDSLSYTTGLHRVMQKARESGVVASLAMATQGDTVFLPYVPAALLGPVIAPSRMVGVWIQALELVVLCASLVTYLMRVERFSARTALLACAPVALMSRLWQPMGGLSDFRMDFGLMAGYWTTAAWYLISRATLARRDFLILGVACGAACLMRATAPVYILCGMGPLALADLVRLPERGRRAVNFALAALVACAVAGWFYALNYDYLYYYYVVWNNDTAIRLAPRRSWRHGLLAIRHAGAAAILLAAIVRAAIPSMAAGSRVRLNGGRREFGVRPEILWLTVAPIVMLMIQGAGLNPFVSMPASLGLLLAIVVPGRLATEEIRLSDRLTAWLTAAAAILAAITVTISVAEHHDPSRRAMTSHKSILRAIADDARTTGATSVSVGASAIGPVHAASLHNVTLYDMQDNRAGRPDPALPVIVSLPDPSLEVSSLAVWRDIPGDAPEEKLRSLGRRAEEAIDYLVVPTASTCRFLEQRLGHEVINRHATAMRDRLMESGVWQRILADIDFDNGMQFDLFRNSARRGTGGRP